MISSIWIKLTGLSPSVEALFFLAVLELALSRSLIYLNLDRVLEYVMTEIAQQLNLPSLVFLQPLSVSEISALEPSWKKALLSLITQAETVVGTATKSIPIAPQKTLALLTVEDLLFV